MPAVFRHPEPLPKQANLATAATCRLSQTPLYVRSQLAAGSPRLTANRV